MKKINKRYVVSDESKNMDGFRVRTSGVQVTEYLKNPLLLLMHERIKGQSKEEILPLGNGIDLEFVDNKLTCSLQFDDTDEFALKICNKYENNTMRALSAGLLPIKFEEIDGEMWLTQSILKEISTVDMGSNSEAVGIALYDSSDNLITLSLNDIKKQFKPNIDMKMIQLKASQLAVQLGLKEDAPETEFAKAIDGLVTLAASQKTTIATLQGEKKTAEDSATAFETKYKNEVKLKLDTNINNLVNGAIAEKRITADQKDAWVKLANTDFEGAKAAIEGLPKSPDVMSKINTDEGGQDLTKLSWKELENQGLLVKLKADDYPLFKTKFKERFGVEPTESK